MVRGEWDQAEATLYQVVMTQPELYQRAVVLVGRLSETLGRECPGTVALTERAAAEAAGGWPLLHLVAEQVGLPVAGLDVDQVGRAACAMAGRRLVLGEAQALRRDRIAAARAAGQGWVVLEESGDPEGVAWAPYRRVEVRSDSGHGVLVTTEPDDDLTGAVHRVLPVVVDPATGGLVPDPVADDPAEPLPDAEAREALVDRIRSAAI